MTTTAAGTLTIIDYGMGNLRSVQKAMAVNGHEAAVSGDADAVASADRLILPGVGAFGDGMAHLRERGLVEPLKDAVKRGVPVLGICLGMQLVMDSSTEDAAADDEPIAGLGLVRGHVTRFSEDQGAGREHLKVPHMGWNRLEGHEASPLFADLPEEPYVYFVHSYFVTPRDKAVAAALCTYGQRFCAALQQDNVWATQFHPEKSQRVGLQVLANFMRV